jgi:hypothetical protein
MFGSEPSDIPMMAGEIAGWFDAVYGEKYGGSDCRTITDEDPMTRFERCPDIIEATYVKAREILADYGKI